MHILATFATLCCQTRWPRNHSCTTQEHVSFFRTFSGHFRKFRLFRLFAILLKFANSVQKWKKTKFHMCAHLRKIFTNAHNFRKNISRHVQNFLQMCKSQMCKSANVQKTVVHKMRKSAAQIFFQMQKSANLHCAQKHKCKFLHMSQFRLCTNFFVSVKNFFCKNFL